MADVERREIAETCAQSGCGVSSPIRAVFFDVGGTILRVKPSVGHVYASEAARAGHPVDPAAVNRAFRAAWTRSQYRRRAAGFVTSDDVLRREWREIVSDTFDGLIPGAVVPGVFEKLYEHFASAVPWTVEGEAVALFRRLRSRGVHVGLLSNWDSRLETVLSHLGVRGEFDSVVVSHYVGLEKPHAAMFEAAERASAVDPISTLIVGDSYEHDIEPAIARGWTAIWVDSGTPSVCVPNSVVKRDTFEEAALLLSQLLSPTVS